MSQFFIKSTWPGILAAALVLTACGGGGGGGSSFTPPNINETPVAISGANQNAIAQSVEGGITGTTEGGGAVFGVVIDGDGSSPSVFDFSSTKLLGLVKQGSVSSADLSAGVVQSETIPCDSGSISVSIDIATPASETLVAGDSASLTANNCVDNFDGTTINGGFSLTIDSGLIDFNCFASCPDVAVSVNFNNFRITESAETLAIHGGFTMAMSETSGTASFSGTSLFLIAGVDALHLTDFDISSTTVGVTTSSTVNMTIASTLIDGSITIATTDPILQDVGEQHPHAGTVVVTGAAGATLTIVYLDSTQVELTLDPDGPGGVAANAPVIVAWADM
jgi:hypothetical protein